MPVVQLQKCIGCTQVYCSRCLVARPGCFSGRPACAKCMSLVMGDYTHDYLARQFTVRELRHFLSGRQVPIDGCTEKHDLIELVMQLRRSSAARAEEEEHSRHVTQLRVINANFSVFSSRTLHISWQLHWLPVSRRIDFKLAVLMYQISRGLAPTYLQDRCRLASGVSSGRRLRSVPMFRCLWCHARRQNSAIKTFTIFKREFLFLN